jgi:hypothetical protein
MELVLLLQLECLLFPLLLAVLSLRRQFLLLLECHVIVHALLHFVSDPVGFWPLRLGPFCLRHFHRSRLHHHHRHCFHRMVYMVPTVHHCSLCL